MNQSSIRRSNEADFESVWDVINDGATAYRGHIPADCLHDPYMSQEELQAEIGAGVEFWGFYNSKVLSGVMGLQRVRDVLLIRHAYVRTEKQGLGIGGYLLKHLLSIADAPVLVGTWATASWAVRFYLNQGFQLVSTDEKARLLREYWRVPDRQIDTSVVLADSHWFSGRLHVSA
jgi:GNAT superfamily N-acetyltransferase